MDISFFTKPPPQKAKAKAKPEDDDQPGMTKRERAAVRAYFKADPVERKRLLRDQGDAEKQAKLDARRAWRRGYMAQYRSLKLWTTVLF
jgi:hypothetical protein